MPRYRARPITIDAERVATLIFWALHEVHNLPGWCKTAYDKREIVFTEHKIHIARSDGPIGGASTDMLVCVAGDFSLCSPEEFEIKYEALGSRAFDDKYKPFAETLESYGRMHSTEEARGQELHQGVKDPKKETKE